MMELPAMSEALLEDKYRNDWEPVVNLDVFFSDMYTYFYHRGLYPLVITQICAVLSLGFTVAFSVFLIAYVDWSELMSCHDEFSCQDIGFYVHRRPFFQSLFGFICLGYLLLFSAYWIWRCVSAFQVISQAMNMERFYREKLGISQCELEGLRWDEVVERLIRSHEQGIHRVAVSEQLTEHDVVSRILRKENYLVALINKAVLNLRLPWWMRQLISVCAVEGPGPAPAPGSDHSGQEQGQGQGQGQHPLPPSPSQSLFLTKSLEWSLYFCILQYMFDDQFTVSSQFLRDVRGLQKRFMVVGAVHVLLLPFLLVFMVVHFFLQNAQQFHSSRAYLGPRQWSPLALWMFREFNELPHVFELRMCASLEPAAAYLGSFHCATTAALARFVVYISGSVVAVILLCSVMGDGILLYVRFGDHNLLWLLGLFSAVLAAARSLVPDDSSRLEARKSLIEKVAACTHHMPTRWMHRADSNQVKGEFSALFPFKARLFAMEVLSVGLTPLVLLFSLPECAPAILQFLKEHTVYVEGLGSVCDYSRFNLEQYGDEKFGTAVSGSLPDRSKPIGPKLEQSLLNFSLHHPNWLAHAHQAPGGGGSGGGVGGGGQEFLSRIHAYKDQMLQRRDAQLSAALLRRSPGRMYKPSPLAFSSTHSYEHGGESNHVHGHVPLEVSQVVFEARQQSDNLATPQPSPRLSAAGKPVDGKDPAAPPPAVLTEPSADLAPGRLEASFTLGSPLSPEVTHHSSLSVPLESLSFQYSDPHRRPVLGRNLSGEGSMYGSVIMGPFGGSLGFSQSSAMSSPDGVIGRDMDDVGVPSVLRSVLRDEKIDFENDFYWLMKFQQERARDPQALEHSLTNSTMTPHSRV